MRSGREYPEHPLVGVGGFIHRDGRVLLIRRRFEPNRGRWAPPGGLLEIGEDPQEAARREVREELGLEVEVEGLLQVANEVIRDERGRVRFHYVLIDYLMRPLGEEITLNEESDEFAWFEPSAVEGLDATANTKLVTRRYAERMKPVGP
ncbi:MAG: NUDIX domain-containing protein [Nitrososphaerales archaeon]|jgi:ADP-ribose pyrophosphatase YjhB (NUDIX family)